MHHCYDAHTYYKDKVCFNGCAPNLQKWQWSKFETPPGKVKKVDRTYWGCLVVHNFTSHTAPGTSSKNDCHTPSATPAAIWTATLVCHNLPAAARITCRLPERRGQSAPLQTYITRSVSVGRGHPQPPLSGTQVCVVFPKPQSLACLCLL